MFCFAFGQRDFTFDAAVFPMQIQRYQRIAFLLDLAYQTPDFFLVQQQFSRTNGVRVDMGGRGFQRVDLTTDNVHLAAAYHHVAVGQLHFSLARSFDFPPFQDHACFQAFLEKVVEGGFFVVRDTGLGCSFAGHKREIGYNGVFTIARNASVA